MSAVRPKTNSGAQQLTTSDLRDALRLGWRDFQNAPQYGIFFGLLYAAGGWAIVLLLGVSGYFFLAYPVTAGFALIAPFVAAALYEVSRRLEQSLPLSWHAMRDGIRAAGRRDLGWMALITFFGFFIWVDIAVFLYAMFFGLKAPSAWFLLTEVFTTARGMIFFVTGNLIGAAIASVIYAITVISFPMLLDRDCDFVTAMMASARTVRENRKVMIIWAAIIVLLLVVSFATALLALIVILPWLAHASWHLYRRVAPGL